MRPRTKIRTAVSSVLVSIMTGFGKLDRARAKAADGDALSKKDERSHDPQQSGTFYSKAAGICQ